MNDRVRVGVKVGARVAVTKVTDRSWYNEYGRTKMADRTL